MTEILCHFGFNIKGMNLLVSVMSGDARLFNKFPMNSGTKQSEYYARYLAVISNGTGMVREKNRSPS